MEWMVARGTRRPTAHVFCTLFAGGGRGPRGAPSRATLLRGHWTSYRVRGPASCPLLGGCQPLPPPTRGSVHKLSPLNKPPPPPPRPPPLSTVLAAALGRAPRLVGTPPPHTLRLRRATCPAQPRAAVAGRGPPAGALGQLVPRRGRRRQWQRRRRPAAGRRRRRHLPRMPPPPPRAAPQMGPFPPSHLQMLKTPPRR